jgi:hypothetical protein
LVHVGCHEPGYTDATSSTVYGELSPMRFEDRVSLAPQLQSQVPTTKQSASPEVDAANQSYPKWIPISKTLGMNLNFSPLDSNLDFHLQQTEMF